MLVYVCSPYRADEEEQFNKQLEYTRSKSRNEVKLGNDVVTPHLYYPQFLDDNIEEERNMGMLSAINLMTYCDKVVVCNKFGISKGMAAEIKVAQEKNIKLEYVC